MSIYKYSKTQSLTLSLAIYLFREPAEPTMRKHKKYEQIKIWRT